ncbi:hypothetical protein JL722_11422 [Aureococcus anophagefferens]|nr:hypothetical protein JL722_11422 [Aureococcus anophagefferens]
MYGTLMGMTGLVSSKGRGPTPPPAGPAGKAKGCAAAAKAAKASKALDAGCHLIEMCTGKLVTYERKKAFLIAYESGGKKKQRGRGVATKPPRGASSARARTIATPAARERSLDRARVAPSRRRDQATPAAPPPPPPEPEASSPGWASSILEGLSMSWDSDVAAEAVSEAAPAVDDASSDDEGDAPPGPPRSRRELECRSEALGRRRLALDALVEQYAIRDGDYARRLDALEAEAASTAARVSAEVKDSETDEAAADLLLAGELTRHADTRRTAELEGLELERQGGDHGVGKQRRLANARQVAAETITQGALVRAKTADEITRSLRGVRGTC